ncbi:MAG: DHH family phosphoesterase [Gemmatimonadota bacterium]|jgi:single-stranded-DNA-specific exonuclease|nr:DHH family phosphoesterase [Gemmatimonadota bacterium]
MIRRAYAGRLGSEAAADRFLAARGENFPEPSVLPGMAEAADRVEAALADGERVGVFGHDDADGITSAAIVIETLEALGAEPDAYIPDRNLEGHGLYPDLVRRLAGRGVTLLVTTDGCSANREEAELAATLGMDVLVTDHHEIAADRPPPDRLLNPKADPETARRYGDLTGAGVAALLARELLERAGRGDCFARLLDLLALGTIGDFGDLGRTNRIGVACGMDAVARGDRAAIGMARESLGCGIAPRESQARRLAVLFACVPSVDGCSRGLDALLGRAKTKANVNALLTALAESDQEMHRASEEADRLARELGIDDGAPAVARVEGFTRRMLGKAAGRLSERTGRASAALFVVDGSLHGELRGPEGSRLVDALSGMRTLLASWGGHQVAAGFSADPANADEIHRRLADELSGPAPPRQKPCAEATVALADLSPAFAEDVRCAAPYGRGNPPPTLRIPGATPEAVAALPFVEEVEDAAPGGPGQDLLVNFLPSRHNADRIDAVLVGCSSGEKAP